MKGEISWRDEADYLIALHGEGAICALVNRIAEAVRLCDDQAVRRLDTILQLIEARLEGPWRLPAGRSAGVEAVALERSSWPF